MQTNPVNIALSTLPAAGSERRSSSHLVLSVTRYASLDSACLDAAIKNGLEELLSSAQPDEGGAKTLYVYYRLRHGSAVTVDIGIPIGDTLDRQPVTGAIRRRQKTSRLSLPPSAAPDGLASAMDEAVTELGLRHRTELPECWQTFALPFTEYDATATLCIGQLRHRRAKY